MDEKDLHDRGLKLRVEMFAPADEASEATLAEMRST
jgi:hypothetical protein